MSGDRMYYGIVVPNYALAEVRHIFTLREFLDQDVISVIQITYDASLLLIYRSERDVFDMKPHIAANKLLVSIIPFNIIYITTDVQDITFVNGRSIRFHLEDKPRNHDTKTYFQPYSDATIKRLAPNAETRLEISAALVEKVARSFEIDSFIGQSEIVAKLRLKQLIES